ncbi:phosphate/phosphite/phosphonate ABC transporter substrate-binding protein [Rhodobacter sp. Har01]|uniref:phosphate/phosphite/phosphonate ABC transporter substrate-binding protein n=1 Tax=Rhodobacter sp. Har01 TaxID=2883999 RepID=UPI001D07484E|nr:PhnD/SsuA/transferrin family substrate-binding protein [Rhodobacter sp. Har01]MCB6178867.1 phosphate/phosphite/phosphonate ABC transporter substrate-binding protein [Rhodobacter sp. Har01]
MIASLGMYDAGPARAANDRFWVAIRDRLRARNLPAPEALTRGEGAFWPAWESPDLVLSQTCGYPFRARLQGRVTLVGTPDHGLPGCPPGHYRSVFVARKDDLRGLKELAATRFAWNEDLSQSGWAGPVSHLLGLGLTPHPCLRSGAHRLSALAVAEGRADLAGLDAVTWAMMQADGDPAAPALRVVAETAPAPALPYIAAKGADREGLFATLAQAIAALTPEDRARLLLHGLVEIPAAAYLAVPTPPPPAHFGAVC